MRDYTNSERVAIETQAAKQLASAASDYLETCCEVKSAVASVLANEEIKEAGATGNMPILMAFCGVESAAHQQVRLFQTFMDEYNCYDANSAFAAILTVAVTDALSAMRNVTTALLSDVEAMCRLNQDTLIGLRDCVRKDKAVTQAATGLFNVLKMSGGGEDEQPN